MTAIHFSEWAKADLARTWETGKHEFLWLSEQSSGVLYFRGWMRQIELIASGQNLRGFTLLEIHPSMHGLRVADHVVFYIRHWNGERTDIIRILPADETLRSNFHWLSWRDKVL